MQIFSNVEQLVQANILLMNKLIARKDSNAFVSEVGDLLSEAAEVKVSHLAIHGVLYLCCKLSSCYQISTFLSI
jgi:hypothetical protein